MRDTEFDKKVLKITEIFDKYNSINKYIKRFGIFNSFSVSHQVDGRNLYFELRNTDNEEFDLMTSAESEQSIMISIDNNVEYNWLVKTMHRFLEKSKAASDKARQLAKPQVGILIYDEFTDTYYLNPHTGPILLKTKEISKEIASTRLDIFGIFMNLRTAILERNRVAEVMTDNYQTINKKIIKSIENINQLELKLKKIEDIPRYKIVIKNEGEKNIAYAYATVDFGDNINDLQRIFNESEFALDSENTNEVENNYKLVRMIEETQKQMVELGRSLITRIDPKLYWQDIDTKLWRLTAEGRETMNNLNIMDFLNNDITEVDFEIN
ncbi:hypothetical protein [Spiroplasma culicicola]|uniref:Uncharacterized protein n=1 Tax=Spiroplasma culicicola AES-1 TaxID=1276246 RepID=W6AGP3_9MOLU|nr:hypothetical protein [Spiroplasma culicicola]AHI52854.1 hypothetical protein SCULI_v1c05130 [Spiroplasma culicicola AES-1]